MMHGRPPAPLHPTYNTGNRKQKKSDTTRAGQGRGMPATLLLRVAFPSAPAARHCCPPAAARCLRGQGRGCCARPAPKPGSSPAAPSSPPCPEVVGCAVREDVGRVQGCWMAVPRHPPEDMPAGAASFWAVLRMLQQVQQCGHRQEARHRQGTVPPASATSTQHCQRRAGHASGTAHLTSSNAKRSGSLTLSRPAPAMCRHLARQLAHQAAQGRSECRKSAAKLHQAAQLRTQLLKPSAAAVVQRPRLLPEPRRQATDTALSANGSRQRLRRGSAAAAQAAPRRLTRGDQDWDHGVAPAQSCVGGREGGGLLPRACGCTCTGRTGCVPCVSPGQAEGNASSAVCRLALHLALCACAIQPQAKAQGSEGVSHHTRQRAPREHKKARTLRKPGRPPSVSVRLLPLLPSPVKHQAERNLSSSPPLPPLCDLTPSLQPWPRPSWPCL